eukprot:TRINITY_DN33313_c0_g1_i1.p1 TRINITY_DN33313_c0_g1~~TRINITY_DN33313_c0_g1_i1.p1  ORF type:complete len:266 (-),score=33.85 TRINITY_DN33313_c0_g1_i1:68-796(-)
MRSRPGGGGAALPKEDLARLLLSLDDGSILWVINALYAAKPHLAKFIHTANATSLATAPMLSPKGPQLVPTAGRSVSPIDNAQHSSSGSSWGSLKASSMTELAAHNTIAPCPVASCGAVPMFGGSPGSYAGSTPAGASQQHMQQISPMRSRAAAAHSAGPTATPCGRANGAGHPGAVGYAGMANLQRISEASSTNPAATTLSRGGSCDSWASPLGSRGGSTGSNSRSYEDEFLQLAARMSNS